MGSTRTVAEVLRKFGGGSPEAKAWARFEGSHEPLERTEGTSGALPHAGGEVLVLDLRGEAHAALRRSVLDLARPTLPPIDLITHDFERLHDMHKHPPAPETMILRPHGARPVRAPEAITDEKPRTPHSTRDMFVNHFKGIPQTLDEHAQEALRKADLKRLRKKMRNRGM